MINLEKMEILLLLKLTSIKKWAVDPEISSMPLTRRIIPVFTTTLLMSKIATRICGLVIRVG